MIFTAKTILPISTGPILDGAVVVKGEQIEALGPVADILPKFPSEEIRDFGRAIILPGLVNLHTHLEYNAFSELVKYERFTDWLLAMVAKRRTFKSEDWRRSAQEGARELLSFGTTCVADIVTTGPGLEVALDAGLRGVSYLELVALDDLQLGKIWPGFEARVVTARERVRHYACLKVGISPHSAYSLTRKALRTAADLANRRDLPIAIHVAETKDEVDFVSKNKGELAQLMGEFLELDLIREGGSGKSPVAYLDGLGLMGDRTLVIHGVYLAEGDLDILCRKGVRVAACPRSNALFGGKARLDRFEEAGIPWGLGTDSRASNQNLNLLAEMAEARVLMANADSPVALSAEQWIRHLTFDAAKILGLENYVGSLEPGKLADMAVVRAKAVSDDPYLALVESAESVVVEATILGGRVVFRRE